MIDSLFTRHQARSRHHTSPLLSEREQYFMHLLHRGTSPRRVSAIASELLNVIRLLNMKEMRTIESSELREAGQRWLLDPHARRQKSAPEESAAVFCRIARGWLQFHQSFRPQAATPGPYSEVLHAYRELLSQVFSQQTAIHYFSFVRRFLEARATRSLSLASISIEEVELFLDEKRALGYKARSLSAVCQSIRNFLRFTESRGWTRPNMAQHVKGISVRRIDPKRIGPRWSDICKLVAPADNTAADVRSRAVLLFCSIYAMRGSEVASLTLADIDWAGETVTLRRAKSGVVQRFPFQFAVGEAVLDYLRFFHPACTDRHLFVTLTPPYRAISLVSIREMIRQRMKRLDLVFRVTGPHDLRRSCATELLRKGFSLAQIADFLGHRDLQTVSVYAKCSFQAVRTVAPARLGVSDAIVHCH